MPLHLCAKYGDRDVFVLLLEFGADMFISDKVSVGPDQST
jgi:ankyrin repeat protein